VIVVDTSALVAMFRREPEARQFYEAIGKAPARYIPPSCLVEFRMLNRYGGDRKTWLTRLIEVQDMEVTSFTPDVAEIAAEAAERYGRGTRHPARLNFGDCLSYAVAKHLDAPLLYKGSDFVHTDIKSALAS
jgi:ribonuclease VapC